jgi:hypothetical protein
MQDRNNDVEVSGYRIKPECIILVQQEMANWPSVRFLCNPDYSKYESCYRVAFGGRGNDVREFEKSIETYIYEEPKLIKKSLWKRLFGKGAK